MTAPTTAARRRIAAISTAVLALAVTACGSDASVVPNGASGVCASADGSSVCADGGGRLDARAPDGSSLTVGEDGGTARASASGPGPTGTSPAEGDRIGTFAVTGTIRIDGRAPQARLRQASCDVTGDVREVVATLDDGTRLTVETTGELLDVTLVRGDTTWQGSWDDHSSPLRLEPRSLAVSGAHLTSATSADGVTVDAQFDC